MQPALAFCFWHSLHLVDAAFVLEVFIDVCTRNLEHALLATLVDRHVLHEVHLLRFEAHQPTVSLVHVENFLTEEATLATTGSLHYFECAVASVYFSFGQENIDDFLGLLLNLFLDFGKLLVCYIDNFLVLFLNKQRLAVLHLLKAFVVIFKVLDLL